MRFPIPLFFFALTFSAFHSTPPGIRARVTDYRGRPTIFINNRPVAPVFYALTDVPGGRRSWDEVPQHNVERFCADGIRLFQVDVFLEQLWMEDGSLRLDYARKQVQGIQSVCPDAVVFFRLHVNAPRWWMAKHPEENVRYDRYTRSGSDWQSLPDNVDTTDYSPDITDGLSRLVEADPRNPLRTSLASRKWRTEMAGQVARFCRKFAQTAEGQSLAGIQIACGVYGEWHQWGFLKWEADLSDPMNTYFRHWLREKYGSTENLQTNWNDSSATFETALVPGLRERGILSAGNFRDPRREQKVIDYYQCQHELVADDILFFCRTVKQHWPRPVITGAFYGYFFSCFNRQAAGGHLALQRVLESPDIDYLAGPQAYLPEAEKPGEPYRSRSLLLSMRLHGKLWLDEMDQQPRRTFAYNGGTRDNRANYARAVRENTAQLRRNLLFSHSKGAGLWLYDFGPAGMYLNAKAEHSPQWGSQGYWDHPDYHKAVREFKSLADKTLHQPYKSEADVLFVYDTEVNYHTKSLVANADSVSLQLIDYMSLAAFYTGAVFDPVHLDDLDLVDFSPYKVVVFANTFLLGEEDKKVIRDKIARDGRHLVWLYAPGYSDGKKPDERFPETVTGISLEKKTEPGHIIVDMDKAVGDSIVEHLWGRADPFFAVADSKAEVFGRFRRSGLPAVAAKQMEGHTSWFSAVPLLDFRSLRFVFGRAGVHFYTDEKAVVYAGSGFITAHFKNGGAHTLTLRDGRKVALELPEGPATVVLSAENGEVVMGGH